TSVALDKELHKRLAIAAVEDGAAMTELVREAVTDWLNRRERKGRGKR
ncbi:MAG: hypothetical protein IH846_16885, partial [Acidobacteria bacterium]|nr:hypothetical protein [Acidobacteriota bacterium]